MLELIKRNRIILSALVVLSALALLLTLRWTNPAAAFWLDEIIQGAAYPFQSGYARTSNALGKLVSDYVFLVDVKQENERLKLQVKALEEELNHHVNASVQFNMLREQLQFLEETPER